MEMAMVWNWIGVTGMFISVVVFGLNTRRATDEYSHQSAVGLFFVPLIALALYPIMAIGPFNNGRVQVDGRTVYWIRYVTWFRTLRNVNTVVWIGYPLIWILGTAGFNLFGVGTQSMLYTILDIVSKVGFGLIIVARRPAVARSAQLAPPQMAT